MRKTLLIALMTGSLALGAVSTYAGGYSGSVMQVHDKNIKNNSKKINKTGEKIRIGEENKKKAQTDKESKLMPEWGGEESDIKVTADPPKG